MEHDQQLDTENGGKNERLFDDIDPAQRPTEVESLCMQCGNNGMTRLLLTRVPHFREVILMAFECPHCGWRNNEIQSGSSIGEKGCRYTCEVRAKADLNRQIVKGEQASIRFEELDFEIPSGTQSGQLNTVEGFISKAVEDLSAGQEARKEIDLNVYQKVQEIINDLQKYLDSEHPRFTLVVDDPTGNSYIENLCAPQKDPQLSMEQYKRTREQDMSVGIDPDAPQPEDEEPDPPGKDEIFTFPANCPMCHAPCASHMKVVDIPYFKEVVLMSTSCDQCGYKSNEVKAGGAVAEHGKRITLKVQDQEDMSRDILKSESAGFRIPEIDLELDSGTLGGRFTTIEGLLQNIYEELDTRAPFSHGDSTADDKRKKLDQFLLKLKEVLELRSPFTVILDDPLGNSYLQNLYAPDPDPNMTIELYERSWEQNEFLGLNDMKTENYGEEEIADATKRKADSPAQPGSPSKK